MRRCLDCAQLIRRGSRCLPCARRRRPTGRPWQRVRAAVLKASSGRCARCGDPATEVDHVVPLQRGGSGHTDNLQPLCAPCHRRKTGTDAHRKGEGGSKVQRFQWMSGNPGSGFCAVAR